MDLKVPVRNSKFNKKNYEEYYEMGKATIHIENNFQNFEKIEINTKKLDEINFENRISFIKIDVEGHEREVIEGGLDIIKEFKPKLLVEIEKKYTKKNVSTTINYINSLGYNSFIYINNSLKKTEDIKELDIYNNYIFLPI
jgi:Holliday junction resolvasome RuvABC endonuclease subunit